MDNLVLLYSLCTQQHCVLQSSNSLTANIISRAVNPFELTSFNNGRFQGPRRTQFYNEKKECLKLKCIFYCIESKSQLCCLKIPRKVSSYNFARFLFRRSSIWKKEKAQKYCCETFLVIFKHCAYRAACIDTNKKLSTTQFPCHVVIFSK